MRSRNWLKSSVGNAAMGVVGIALGYFFATRAIDTGSWWEYLGALVFVVLGVKLIIRAIKQR